jgi:hypothetical protein
MTAIPCLFEKTKSGWGCTRCGRQVKLQSAKPPVAVCKAGPGLGDMVASGLWAVGITKERVSAAFGKPCRCGERQQKMNEFGRKYLGIG